MRDLVRVWECDGLFSAVHWDLDWINNTDLSPMFDVKYKFCALSIPSPELTVEQLQLTADCIRERYNKLYENLHLPFNPLYNVDAWEEYVTNRDGDNKSEGNAKEYPMNSNTSRPVSTTDGKSDFRENTVERRRRYGNIGVTKTTELIESANNMLRDLISDYMDEFGDWFMYTTKGEF